MHCSLQLLAEGLGQRGSVAELFEDFEHEFVGLFLLPLFVGLDDGQELVQCFLK